MATRDGESGGFGACGVYIPSLGRSVAPKLARILFDDRRLRGRLVCDAIRCCPRGAESMLESSGRRHAVRSRARQLQELAEIPNESWRLNHIAKQAAVAQVTALKANEILASAGVPNRIKPQGYDALERVTEFLLSRGAARHSA